MNQRYERIYDVVRRIPLGRVATYGMVAMVAGYPRAARFAGLAMHHCDDPSVPCHRVVNASGGLAPGFLTQRARLESEGVRFSGPRVELARSLWTPRLPRPPRSPHAAGASRPRRRPGLDRRRATRRV